MGDHSDAIPSARCHFVGSYRQKVEQKGRITLPSACRRAMPAGVEGIFMLRQSPTGPCVQLIPVEEWRRMAAERGARSGATGRELVWQQRALFSQVEESSIDHKGRVVANPELLAANGIAGEVLVVGVNRLIELWNPEAFFAELERQSAATLDVEDLLYG
jgi:MraZ protein